MTFEEYAAQVGAVKAQNPHWRYGQTYFNVLAHVRPDLSEQVRGVVALDPFYKDENLPAFLHYIYPRW